MRNPNNAELDVQVLRKDRKGHYVLYAELRAHSTKEWLVDKLLGAGEASAFYGKPGDGKSVLVEDLGLHVAWGKPWHGRPVRRGAVLYVALERRMLVERRAIAFRVRHGIRSLPFAILGGVYDLRDKRNAISLVAIAREVERETGEPLVLIIIDTLSRALAGGDENSPKDMGAIVAATSIIQNGTTAHVMWVHHMPLDGGERMRGHGALLGALDTTIHVVKGHDGRRAATVTKANDSEEGEAVAFALEPVVTDCETETTAPVVVSIETTASMRPKPTIRLTKAAQTALRALRETISERGAVPPASNHIPSNVRVVTVEQWRTYAYQMGISAADSGDRARRAAFQRATEQLIGASVVGVWGDHAWPV
jgi:hypothetical protein